MDWSPWTAVSGNNITSPSGRYFQYRAALSTASVIQSPELQQVEIRYYGPSSLTVSPNPATLDPATGQQFVAQVYDDNGQPIDNLAYSWQVVNGGGDINSTGLFTAILNAGTYTNTVQATSGSLTGLATVIVRNLPPIADAGGPYTGDETQNITPNGSNSTDPNGSSLDYAWDLDGDGQFDDAATAATSYSWAEPGVYTVTLRVTDSQGLTDTDTAVVTVNNLAPTANAGGPYSGSEGVAIPLSGSGSDPGGGDVEYVWDLNGDGQFDDATTAATSYTWGEPGVYTVTLRVTDSASLTDTDTAQVTVSNLPPVAEAGDSYTGVEGAAVSLNGFGFDAGSGDVAYAWDLDEDGQFDDAATAVTSYNWSEPGVYTITLQVSDSQGLTDTDTAQVTINNLPPSADAGGPYSGNENQTVTLDGLVSADPGGGGLAYAWDFDEDGQLDDATVAQPGYTWSSPGIYTVTLQVTDSQGLTGTDTAQVTINNLPPSADAGGPYSGNEGAAINLSGSGSDPGIGAVSYAWDLDGDGQFDDALAAITSYTWNVTGTFTITLQVTDAQGATATDTAQVTVSVAPAPPSTNIFLPLIFNGGSVSAGQPDLTPQVLLIEPGSGLEATTPVELSVVIKNTGTGVAAANFWVDMYINPLPFPNEAGHLWGMLCPTPPNPPANPCADDYGLAWQVTTPLAPGQVITLTSSIGDPYLAASPHTVWPGSFNKSGLTALWVYVDSWNGVNVPAGFIAESNETNNRLGPVSVNVTGAGVTNPSDTGLSENQSPPVRPLPQ
ncbi:MAG: PKD domain-containing protein [Anaerolineales bacterium]|nr:PKD domain-containing protein [Anaerolineales bacterium]